jgi:hypothetical protein
MAFTKRSLLIKIYYYEQTVDQKRVAQFCENIYSIFDNVEWVGLDFSSGGQIYQVVVDEADVSNFRSRLEIVLESYMAKKFLIFYEFNVLPWKMLNKFKN